MKNIYIVLLFAFVQSTFAQGDNVSMFHRLLIYNERNEIMLVKVKGPEIWVTPGFYQDSNLLIKKGLVDIAATYGLTVSSPQLAGIFSMKRKKGDKNEMLMRHLYRCNIKSGIAHFPQEQPFTINEIKWVSIEEAKELLSFNSIKMFVNQTHHNPNIVSGGSIELYKENDTSKIKILEPFYPLFQFTKRKKWWQRNK